MIQHVYTRAEMISGADTVLVATDSEDILKNVKGIGGNATMTKTSHDNGTSRVAEIADSLTNYDYFMNIQGDEIFIQPQAVESLIAMLKSSTCSIVSLMTTSSDESMLSDSNVVKVVTDAKNKALYFSRSPIPFSTDRHGQEFLTHIGVYGYRRETLLELAKLPIGQLEKAERLEQLRWLEHDYDIQMLEVVNKAPSINTAEDLILAEEYLSRISS